MAIKVCRVCGKEFESKTAGKVCESCKHVKCVVCGSDVELKGQTLYRYLERGWATCSQACAAKKRAETNIERYGDANPARSEQARKKISDARKNEDEYSKRLRAAKVSEAKKSNRTCAICHKPFKATTSQVICDDCRTVKCCVCGKEINLMRARVTRYLEEGKITCSRKCSYERGKNTNIERYGASTPLVLSEHKGKGNIERAKIYGSAEDCVTKIKECLSLHPNYTIRMIADAIGVSEPLVRLYNRKYGIGIRTHVSTMEQVIAEFLDSLGVPYVRNTRSVIAPYELDFYMPEHGVAIEVNDFATHNIDLNPFGGKPKPKRYHWDKTRMCDERGIRLIHAWQHCLPTWEGDSGRMGSWPVLQNVIIHALGMTPHRHYARQMRVVEFPAIQTKKFFDENNINGYRNANVTYALVPKNIECPTPDDIVMAYAVGRAYFGKGKYDAEIARGACLLGHNVAGGASKLWRYIIDNTDYQSIVYYTDRNFYQSNSLGFLENVEYVTHQDSFWNYWVDEDRLANREPMRHAEIMRKREAGEVWQVNNAGTDVFVWRR